MEPTSTQRKQTQRIIEKWRPRLYLNEWHFDISYVKNSPEHDPSAPGGGCTICDINPCPVYLQALVRIYPDFWSKPEWVREKALVHELSHCLTVELYELLKANWNDQSVSQREAREKLERLTQRITHVALYQQGK